MADIVIPVAICLFTLLLAYLGVHITMFPADTDNKKLAYKSAFVVCGFVMCVLIGVQAYRSNQSQQLLIAQMGRIEANTISSRENSGQPTSPPVPKTTVAPHSNINSSTAAPIAPPPAGPHISQQSEGPCSPNIVGNNNSTNCEIQPELTATQQIQQRMSNGEWLTTFTVSSNKLIQTGDLHLVCDGPVLRAGISRINPSELITGSNGPSTSDPNVAIYELGPEMLSPNRTVSIGVYSMNPIHVIRGTLGPQEIKFSR